MEKVARKNNLFSSDKAVDVMRTGDEPHVRIIQK